MKSRSFLGILAFVTVVPSLTQAIAAEVNPHDQAANIKVAAEGIDARIAAMGAPSEKQLAELSRTVDDLLARKDLEAYRGWLKYLRFRAHADAERNSASSTEAKKAYLHLSDWVARIQEDPQVLSKLRGVQEWAYESEADGSGQPFKIAIPTDYDPARPAGLGIYCHGYSGNHLEHSAGMAAHPGDFDLAVLGRSRAGWYRMLSERDVLDVLAYVKRTWKLDENRIHLGGGSMGGFATMWLGSRYPDLFSCVTPTCGYALQSPIENLAPVPLYSLHSKDDPVVLVVSSRGPLLQLQQAGGKVVIEETNGFGHAVWNWSEGGARAGEWTTHQVRPAPESVKEVRYIAMDGIANGAWWARVVGWGPVQAPAKMSLKFGAVNQLYGSTQNVARLRLNLAKAPVNRSLPLEYFHEGAAAVTLKAPLPEEVDLVISEAGAVFESPAQSAVRPHTPGAASLVYDGSPLLIVYGTSKGPASAALLKAAAEAASKSPNCVWQTEEGDKSPADGVPHRQNLYGHLRVKADVEVTEEDLRANHLVLIGTVSENSLVAKLAGGLPVKENGDTLTTSDHYSYPINGYAWSLVHYNPLAPRRLVLWLASRSEAFYRAGARLPMELMAHGHGADFVVMNPEGAVATARAFSSDWNWEAAYAESPLLTEAFATKPGWATAHADLLRRSSGAAFGVAALELREGVFPAESFQAVKGVTRLRDLAVLNYLNRIYVLELKGKALLNLRNYVLAHPDALLKLSSNFAGAALNPEETYTVAIDNDSSIVLPHALGELAHDILPLGTYEVEAFKQLP